MCGTGLPAAALEANANKSATGEFEKMMERYKAGVQSAVNAGATLQVLHSCHCKFPAVC